MSTAMDKLSNVLPWPMGSARGPVCNNMGHSDQMCVRWVALLQRQLGDVRVLAQRSLSFHSPVAALSNTPTP